MIKRLIVLLLSVIITLGPAAILAPAQNPPSILSFVGGRFIARNYNYAGVPITSGGGAAGTSYTITLAAGSVALRDGRTIVPFSAGGVNTKGQAFSAPAIPITVGAGSVQETVTPTAVSGCYIGAPQNTCSITASFTNAHGRGEIVVSGSYGIQEAINDAATTFGGGIIEVDASIGTNYGANAVTAALRAANVMQSVSIEDDRLSAPQIWNVTPTTTTVLATPAVLTSQAACDATHTFCSDATVAGSASWGSTVYGCITYVDIMGNESPACSTTASFTSVASKAIDIGAPIASTGAVGWKPYLSVSGGSYALTYSVPLMAQPATIGAAPSSNGYCTLTTLETTTPACAVANTSYGQAGSNLVFTGYPVVTSQLSPNLGSASAATYNANTGGHTIYSYVPGSHWGIPGVTALQSAFPITTAAQSTIPQVAGSIALPPQFMNNVGRGIQVCGMLSKTSTTADTITNIQLWWDAEGSNVSAGTPVELSNIQITATLTAAASIPFCQNIYTSVASASATGGTIQPGLGWLTEAQVSAGTIHFASSNILFAAVGSLNLALNSRLDVIYNHTTGTDGAGVLLINPTVTVLN